MDRRRRRGRRAPSRPGLAAGRDSRPGTTTSATTRPSRRARRRPSCAARRTARSRRDREHRRLRLQQGDRQALRVQQPAVARHRPDAGRARRAPRRAAHAGAADGADDAASRRGDVGGARRRRPRRAAPWPEADPELLVGRSVTLPVQINGKRRAEIVARRRVSTPSRSRRWRSPTRRCSARWTARSRAR